MVGAEYFEILDFALVKYMIFFHFTPLASAQAEIGKKDGQHSVLHKF